MGCVCGNSDIKSEGKGKDKNKKGNNTENDENNNQNNRPEQRNQQSSSRPNQNRSSNNVRDRDRGSNYNSGNPNSENPGYIINYINLLVLLMNFIYKQSMLMVLICLKFVIIFTYFKSMFTLELELKK